MVFLDFQFMRIVFLAIVRDVRSSLWLVLSIVSVVVSPKRQSDGDRGMRQSIKSDRDPMTSFQKSLIGVQ